MIPTSKNILNFSHPHTLWVSPPSRFYFCIRDIHKCFCKRGTIFLKKSQKSASETLFLVFFKLEFQLFTGLLNAAIWDVFVATLVQRIKYGTLFNNVLLICQRFLPTPCCLKPFFYLKD